jgi:hypothetical protein
MSVTSGGHLNFHVSSSGALRAAVGRENMAFGSRSAATDAVVD